MSSEENKEQIVRREMVYVLGEEIGSGSEGEAYQLTR